jgi:hypothetical protein
MLKILISSIIHKKCKTNKIKINCFGCIEKQKNKKKKTKNKKNQKNRQKSKNHIFKII